MTKPTKNRALLKELLRAFLLGLLIILAPIEAVLLGAMVYSGWWVFRRASGTTVSRPKHAALLRCSVIALMVLVAAKAPLKHEDRPVGPLASSTVSLKDLEEARIIYAVSDDQDPSVLISLPSTTPTRRQVMHAIREQTNFDVSIHHCFDTATILYGSEGGRIRVRTR